MSYSRSPRAVRSMTMGISGIGTHASEYRQHPVFTLNVPNLLTLLRILLVPVLVVALLDATHEGDILAAVVFAGASITDAIDGWLARRQRAITNFGKLMDPVADKLLIVAALVVLVSWTACPPGSPWSSSPASSR